MRRLTGPLGVVAVIVFIAAAIYLRSGETHSEVPTAPAVSHRVQPPAPRNARLADRPDYSSDVNRDVDHQPAVAAVNPAPNRREVPTIAPSRRRIEELAAISNSDPDDDPEDVVQLRQTLLTNPDPDERIGAVLMLTGEDGPESLRALLEAMDDPNPEVRLAVVEALGDRAEDLDPAVLDSALRDSDPEVRFEAVSILGDMETPEARERIRESLHDTNDDVRALAESLDDEFDEDDFDDDEQVDVQAAQSVQQGQARNGQASR